MKSIRRFLLVLILPVLSASAWDVPGHIMVCKIAYDHTTEHARKKMDELSKTLTFSILRPGQTPIRHVYNGVNFAAWPDNVKHAAKEQTAFAGHFGDWHFVDIGLNAGDPDPYDSALSVKSGDAYHGLKLCIDVITHKQTSPLVPNEAVALSLICHLTGDIHQPLHCTTHYSDEGEGHNSSDAGGNSVAITNFKDSYPELHQFWDTAYKISFDPTEHVYKAGPSLSTFSTTPTSEDLIAAVKAVSQNQGAVKTKLEGDYLLAWINETHQIGKSVVYGELGNDFADNRVTIKAPYAAHAKTVAERQIYVAGLRLAALLSKLYP